MNVKVNEKDIILKNISKSYNGQVILEDINLTIPGGKFFALLGPSGCGKTTILRLIAGFEIPDSGSIYLGNQEITHTPIYQRRVNTVFQNYALFPHLNVFDNVGFGLKVKKVPQDQIEHRVMKVLKMVHLENHAYKSIDHLSGGQQQRVALARSMINEPEVLLLDEPLAALDVKLRQRMHIELMDLQETLKTTFVYVTHDQTEALTVADHMAIMNYDGIIEQVDHPKKVYESPISTYVAHFVGTTTIFSGIIRMHQGMVELDVENLGRLNVTKAECQTAIRAGQEMHLSVRPEKITMYKQEPNQEGVISLSGVIESIVYHGYATFYFVRLSSGQRITVFRQNSEHTALQPFDYDEQIYVSWAPEMGVLLER
ncbi:MAG TPA: ABC transporter ATP-binding protein [Candidatus Babeliales bacterium]|nr:ABC transporter ATP-binding protein [Candidatus Babeliales bacterium]